MNKHIIWALALFLITFMICSTIVWINHNSWTVRFEMDDNTKGAIESIEYPIVEIGQEKEYEIQLFQVLPNRVAYVWSEGVVTCQEYINKSHSFVEPNNNLMIDEVLNPTNDSIYCAYKVLISEELPTKLEEDK